MSKKQKTIRSEKRKAAKRSEKAARRAHYEALRDAKQNRKSKNKLRREGAAQVKNFSHPSGICHNIGCNRCNPAPFNEPRSTELIARVTVHKGAGITTDKVHMDHKIFAPKRQLTKPWGAP